MTKYRTLGPGDGLTGPTGLEYRNLTNDMIPGDAYFVPEDFVWTGDLSPMADRTLIITASYSISGTVTLPDGCSLRFDGGSLLGSFTLIGNSSRITNVRNEKIFDLTVTFSGTWVGDVISPQWFGYKTDNVPTYTHTTEVVSYYPGTNAAPFINKCLDSPFEVYMPNGYYYVSESIIFMQDKVLNLGYARKENLNNNGPYTFRNDHVRIYTDVNDLKMFVLCTPHYQVTRSPSIVGGILDCRAATAYIGTLVYIDADYQIGGGKIKTILLGGKHSPRSGIGAGGWGIKWDTDKIPNYNYGAFWDYEIDVKCWHLYCGIEIMSPRAGTAQWCTEFELKGRMITGCKIGAILNGMSDSTIELTGQTDYVLFESEWDQPYFIFNVSSSTIDFFVWDLRTGGAVGGWYAPKIAARNYGTRTLFIGRSVNQGSNMTVGAPPRSYPFIGSDGGGQFLSGRYKPKTFLPSDNQMSQWNKKSGNTYSIAAYEGVGYDLDQNLTPSISLQTNSFVSLYNVDKLFATIGETFSYSVSAGFDLSNDFVEIVLESSQIRYEQLAIYLHEPDVAPNRIQFIKTTSGGTNTVYNVYPKSPGVEQQSIYRCPMDNTNYTRLIIRLIGLSDIGGVRIIDIAANSLMKAIDPFINSEQGRYLGVAYKSYAGFITQTGTNDPVADLLENNIGLITLARTGVGIYTFNSDGLFTTNKTLPNTNLETHIDEDTGNKFTIRRLSANIIELRTYNDSGILTDGLLNSRYVEIKVFK